MLCILTITETNQRSAHITTDAAFRAARAVGKVNFVIQSVLADDPIVVADGATRWIAERAQLMAAMTKLGWSIDGAGIIKEPRSGDPAEYALLCQTVYPIKGVGTNDTPDMDLNELTIMRVRPDIGGDVWVIEPSPATRRQPAEQGAAP